MRNNNTGNVEVWEQHPAASGGEQALLQQLRGVREMTILNPDGIEGRGESSVLVDDDRNADDIDDDSVAMEEFLQAKMANALPGESFRDSCDSYTKQHDVGESAVASGSRGTPPHPPPPPPPASSSTHPTTPTPAASSSKAESRQSSASSLRSGNGGGNNGSGSGDSGLLSQQQRPAMIHERTQQPTPPSSPQVLAFNPFSCGYSPHKKLAHRKEIMGMSVLDYPNYYFGAGDEENVEDDDESSTFLVESAGTEDSEQALESMAAKIRRELMHTEMTELAVAVEKAADAGESRFTAQPSIFPQEEEEEDGDDEENKPQGEQVLLPKRLSSSALPKTKKPSSVMKRSYSEGARTGELQASNAADNSNARYSRRSSLPMDEMLFSSAWSNTNQNKLSVVDLRDVNEVFPSFRQFHTHLRTHFHRNKVPEQQLLFREPKRARAVKPKAVSPKGGTSLCKASENTMLPLCAAQTTSTPLPPQVLLPNQALPHAMNQMQNDFLRTFSLDQWVPSQSLNSSTEEDTDHAADDIYLGDVLSGHIATYPPWPRPKIQVPPGLQMNDDEYDDLESKSYGRVKLRPRLKRRSSRYQQEHQQREGSSGTMETSETTHSENFGQNIPELRRVFSQPPPGNVKPRALFDETDCDSTTEDDSITRVDAVSKNDKESAHLTSRTRIRLNRADPFQRSVLDENALTETPKTSRQNSSERSNSLVDEEGTSRNPIQTSGPDFVTPSRLREIRGLRKAHGDILKATAANLLLPSNSISEESPARLSEFYRRRPRDIQMPVLETVMDVSESLTISDSRDNSGLWISPSSQRELVVEAEYARGRIEKAPSGDDFGQIVDSGIVSRTTNPMDESVEIDLLPKLPQMDSVAPDPITLMAASALISRPKVTGAGTYTEPFVVSDLSGSMTIPQPEKALAAVAQLENYCKSGSELPSLQTAQTFPDHIGSIVAAPYLPVTPQRPCSERLARSLPGSPVTSHDEFAVQDSFLDHSTPERLPKLSSDGHADHALIATPQVDDCGCLRLSPTESFDSNQNASHGQMKTFAKIRKSTSTGSLNDPKTWNRLVSGFANRKSLITGFADRASPGRNDPIRAAMNMISQISPRYNKREFSKRAMYVRPNENDDFLNNYLYCSKHDEARETSANGVDGCEMCVDAEGRMACGDVNPAYCCTGLLKNSMALEAFLPRKHSAGRSLVKLGGNGMSRTSDPESWFDMANERFDGVLSTWVMGSTRRVPEPSSQFHASFQAPSLKKCRNPRRVGQGRTDGNGDESFNESIGSGTDSASFDEKKTVGLYDIDESSYQTVHADEKNDSLYEPPPSPETPTRNSNHFSLLDSSTSPIAFDSSLLFAEESIEAVPGKPFESQFGNLDG